MFTALTIAGSDCSGGAGIQADLKAFAANGVYGQSAIVALVDENTQGVYDIHKVPSAFVVQQIKTCLDDIGADAIKIGMLDSVEIVRAVKDTLLSYKGKTHAVDRIVLDPVMVSTSGHKLLEDDAIEVLKKESVPLANIITPNVPEAELLLGYKITSSNQFDKAARDLSKLGGKSGHKSSVFSKAGHLVNDEQVVDYFYNADDDEMIQLPHRRIETKNTHGTGCTLSSALAAHSAANKPNKVAAREASEYIFGAIEAGAHKSVGHGHGPVDHFYKWF